MTTGSSTVFTKGTSGSFTLAATGYPMPTWSANGSLPAGLTLVGGPGGTAVLQGTPAVGTYHLSLQAKNAAGTTPVPFTLLVATKPAVTSPDTAGFATGGSPSSFTITTTGSPAPTLTCTVSGSPCNAGHLPGGLAFHDNGDGTAVIYGAPTTTASDQVTITATNAAGSATQVLTVNASPSGGPPITFSGAAFTGSTAVAKYRTGQSGTMDMTTSPGTALSLKGTLPAGLTFSDDSGAGTATVSGTPSGTSVGTYGGDGHYVGRNARHRLPLPPGLRSPGVHQPVDGDVSWLAPRDPLS